MRHAFPVHGATCITVIGSMIRFCLEGPWNAEMILENHRRLRLTLDKHRLNPWVLLVVPVGSALCGPDTLDTMRDCAVRDSAPLGRVATAWVLPSEVEGAEIMRVMLKKVYTGVSPLAFFDREEDATNWLLGCLAQWGQGVEDASSSRH